MGKDRWWNMRDPRWWRPARAAHQHTQLEQWLGMVLASFYFSQLHSSPSGTAEDKAGFVRLSPEGKVSPIPGPWPSGFVSGTAKNRQHLPHCWAAFLTNLYISPSPQSISRSFAQILMNALSAAPLERHLHITWITRWPIFKRTSYSTTFHFLNSDVPEYTSSSLVYEIWL